MSDLDQHLPAILAGEPDAFGNWMAGAEPTLRLSLRRFAAVVDTESVLQETLLRVWQVAPRFVHDGRPNGLLRLGIRIARNFAVSEIRKTHAEPIDTNDFERLLTDVTKQGAVSPPDPMLRRIIQKCRDRLPAKPAQALLARLTSAGGEHDATIAERLGMRKNTFLQNFGRARKFLAECLEENGVDLDSELV